jgi:hypothetical protein
LALCAGLTWAGQAQAENYALLVGASTYDNLDERYWLKGPANDVALVQTYLTQASPVPFAPGDVTLLADGVKGATKPTLAAIRQGFADLQAKVGPGDFVYLHFSGHGTQAPAQNPETELDGLDELFLPVDIGPWDDTVGHVENALIDDEIGQMIDGIRAKGATVWAVFDSCHSGTVTRAAPTGNEEVRLRKLSPLDLGVPIERLDGATSRAFPAPKSTSPRQRAQSPAGDALAKTDETTGGFIAFYAAQTNETTPEKRLPRGKPGRKPQGVFTYTIFETLAEYPGMTYRQLGQEVMRKYAVNNLALSTPMFEGDLDAFVFSGEKGTPIAQWPVGEGEFGLTLRAGQLQNLAEGDLLAILPTAAAGLDQALGYAQITYADTFTAELEPTEHKGLAAPDITDLPRGAFARRISSNVDFTLNVALPEDGTDLPQLDEIIAALRLEIGPRVQLVPAGADADLRLAILPQSPRPDAIWMLPGTGYFAPDQAHQIPSVGPEGRTGPEVAALIQDNLDRMGRAINLLRMGGQLDNNDLNVDLRLRTKNRQNRDLRDMDLSQIPVLLPDDQVHVLARNDEEFPIDANVLHIGSDYSISHFFSGRLNPGDTLKKGLFKITDEAFGRDRVVIILTPAEPQSPVEDLRFLAQDAVTVMRGNGAASSGFAAQLRAAGFGTVTRGAMALDDDSGPMPAILQFDIDTRPAN